MSTSSENRIFSLSANKANLNNGTAYSDLVFTISDFLNPPNHLTACYVSADYANVPTTSYNIDSRNSTVTFTLSLGIVSTTYTLQFTSSEYGNYDVDSFLDMLNQKFAAFPGQSPTATITFAYNGFTGKAEVQWTTPFAGRTMTINFTTMQLLLGITSADLSFTDSSTKAFSNCVNFQGVTSYFFVCAEVPMQNYATEIQSNFLVKIPVAGGSFNATQWTNTTLVHSLIPGSVKVSQLSIRVYDQNAQLVNFNGVPWDLTLKVSYETNRALDYSSLREELLTPPVLTSSSSPSSNSSPST